MFNVVWIRNANSNKNKTLLQLQENFTSIEKKYFDYNSVPAQLYYPYTFLYQDLGPQVTLMDPKELPSLALIAV